jgi:hypothetical protein
VSAIPPTPPSLEEVFNTPPDQLPRNKATEARHQRETWGQIYVPLIIGGLLVVGVMVLTGFAVSTGNSAATRLWADVSLVIVILQVMIVTLPLLILFGGLAWGIGYLVKLVPPYAKVAQDYTALAARKTEWAMQYVVNPILQIRSVVAAVDKFVQNLRRFTGK